MLNRCIFVDKQSSTAPNWQCRPATTPGRASGRNGGQWPWGPLGPFPSYSPHCQCCAPQRQSPHVIGLTPPQAGRVSGVRYAQYQGSGTSEEILAWFTGSPSHSCRNHLLHFLRCSRRGITPHSAPRTAHPSVPCVSIPVNMSIPRGCTHRPSTQVGTKVVVVGVTGKRFRRRRSKMQG